MSAAKMLTVTAVLSLLFTTVWTWGPPGQALPFPEKVAAQAEQPGRILSATGVAYGGIIAFNTDGTNGINLTANTFDGSGVDDRHKSTHPTVARDGTMAFMSNRSRQWRIYLMKSDGSGLRQLTSAEGVRRPDFMEDRYPAISPDGTKVAFVSRRGDVDNPPGSGNFLGLVDIFIINTDGTGLRQVTKSQSGPGGVSRVLTVVWSPDGTKLAFRGSRQIEVDKRLEWHQVVATINADGTEETVLGTLDSAAYNYGALDWSPDGARLVYAFDVYSQGTYYHIRELNTGKVTVFGRDVIGGASQMAGAVRFSPDSRQLVFTAGHAPTDLVFMNIDGTGKVVFPNFPLAGGEGLWWMAGPAIPKPARFELSPNPVVAWRGHNAQITPTLYDSDGKVIAHAATGWGSPAASTGEVIVPTQGNQSIDNWTGKVTASNGGVSATTDFIIANTPIVSLATATPKVAEGASEAGVFTITRIGDPTKPLTVAVKVSGTATEAADYASTGIGAKLTIPAGTEAFTTTKISISPMDDNLREGDETVVLTLLPGGYEIKGPKSAVVTIADNDSGPVKLAVSAIVPNKGGDTGLATVTVHGQAFQKGAQVKLVRAGQPDVIGGSSQVAQDGQSVSAALDLTKKARGPWDVVVANPDGTSTTLTGAFTVEEARAPQVWVDILGRSTIMAGREQGYTIVYGNRGNTDATGVLMVVASVPKDAVIQLGPEFPPSPYEGTRLANRPRFVRSASRTTIPLVIPSVPPGSAGAATVKLTMPTATDFKISVFDVTPLASAVPTTRAALGGTSGGIMAGITGSTRNTKAGKEQGYQWIRDEDAPALETAFNLATAYWEDDRFSYRLWMGDTCNEFSRDLKQRITGAGNLPGSPLAGWTVQNIYRERFVAGHATVLLTSPPPVRRHYVVDNYVSPAIVPMLEVGHNEWIVQADWALTHPWVPFVYLDHLLAPWGIGENWHPFPENFNSGGPVVCGPPPTPPEPPPPAPPPGPPPPPGPNPTATLHGRVVGSRDPNDIAGPVGSGKERYVSGAEPLRYAIFFENVEKATAPAQEVIVQDQLDAARFDLNTLSLGPITFGDKQVIVPPPGLSEYLADVDLRPNRNLIVRVEAHLDRKTGLLLWRLASRDPKTGQLPEDPLAGFLPPNKKPPEGDGSVIFTVMPKPGLPTGAPIANKASIVFDVNAPMDTPEWRNTLDNAMPSSQVVTLEGTRKEPRFEVSWSGVDEGSGVQDYSVFVSRDGGPFMAWQANTALTSATFQGEPGSSYAFYSVARDRAGNLEDVPTSPDASTSVEKDVTASVKPTPAKPDASTSTEKPGPSLLLPGLGLGGVAVLLLAGAIFVLVRKRRAWSPK
ncbi:MAG: PD40 domain-containing protein [Chloroflexi bacterium]|nr:PD40 domain-containing protein [Chloroflexota bacterium]